jgi:hypothetical protein
MDKSTSLTSGNNHIGDRVAIDVRRRRLQQTLRYLGVACFALGLGGCGSTLEKVTKQSGFLVAAEPLCEDSPGYEVASNGTCKPASDVSSPPTSSAFPNKEYVGRVLNESEYNCGKFVDDLVLISNSTNTTLDGLTTVFTALGTAFTPLGVVHGLTAAGSITSGWKTAIDTDVYAKQTIANYAQAIQSGYYTDLHTYIDSLNAVTDDSAIILPIEVAKIRTIHRECSLATAQASISSTMRSDTTPTSSPQPASAPASPPVAPTPTPATPQAVAPTALTVQPPTASGLTTRSVVPGHPIR